MQRDVTDFLFNHYRVHFNSRPALARAYSCIPQVYHAYCCCSVYPPVWCMAQFPQHACCGLHFGGLSVCVVTPQMQIWDDHDIFDGWGSYPDHLQTCPVFQGKVIPICLC